MLEVETEPLQKVSTCDEDGTRELSEFIYEERKKSTIFCVGG